MTINEQAFDKAVEAYNKASHPSAPASRAGLIAAVLAYAEAIENVPIVMPDLPDTGNEPRTDP